MLMPKHITRMPMAKNTQHKYTRLSLKDLYCLYSGNYSGRLVNLNNYPLKNKLINITMYNSGGDRIGIQSSRLKPINEEESKDFHTVRSNFCKDNYKVVIGVD